MHVYINSLHELNLDDDVQEIVRIQRGFQNYRDQVLEHVRKLFVLFRIYFLRLNEELNEEMFLLLVEDLKQKTNKRENG